MFAQLKMKSVIIVTVGSLLLFVLGMFYLTNPLRHSIDAKEFDTIIATDIPTACNVKLLEIISTEFDNKRFPVWERLNITERQLWRDYVSHKTRIAIGRPYFFSVRYVLGNDQQSLILITSGWNNRVCLITIEPPLGNVNEDKECLKIIQKRFKTMVK
jgi:hypothetical protein